MVEQPVKKTWRVRAAGWIAGQRVEAGQRIELTEAEAKYEAVVPAAPPEPAPSEPAPSQPAPGGKRRGEAPQP